MQDFSHQNCGSLVGRNEEPKNWVNPVISTFGTRVFLPGSTSFSFVGTGFLEQFGLGKKKHHQVSRSTGAKQKKITCPPHWFVFLCLLNRKNHVSSTVEDTHRHTGGTQTVDDINPAHFWLVANIQLFDTTMLAVCISRSFGSLARQMSPHQLLSLSLSFPFFWGEGILIMAYATSIPLKKTGKTCHSFSST